MCITVHAMILYFLYHFHTWLVKLVQFSDISLVPTKEQLGATCRWL